MTSDIKRYIAFQEAVLAGLAEAAADDLQEPVFVPSDRCPHHHNIVISNGMFDGLCHICESDMDSEEYR